MTLFDRVFAHPVLRDHPPVLVDVGASGGIPRAWRRLARYSVCLSFEPDAREMAPAARHFRRWILCPKLVVANEKITSADLYLTRSPSCSSMLAPDNTALGDWAFASLFDVEEKRVVATSTLTAALKEYGLTGIDWLKCDTQGTDLRIWQSVPEPLRHRALTVEFEPGLIDAYHGEDKFSHVIAAMESAPFWLAGLDVQQTPRAPMPLLAKRLGFRLARYFLKFGPAAPAWVNALYLRRLDHAPALDLRAHLLLWVFASELDQPAFACVVAEAAAREFDDDLCRQLANSSARQMRRALWATWPRWPGWMWGKFFGN